MLVNSAGVVGPNMPTWLISDADWARTIAVNLNGTFYLAPGVRPGDDRAGWGRIVNIASIAGKEGQPEPRRVLGVEGGRDRSHQVDRQGARHDRGAGQLDRARRDRHRDERERRPNVLEYMISKIPMARTGTADEVAALVAGSRPTTAASPRVPATTSPADGRRTDGAPMGSRRPPSSVTGANGCIGAWVVKLLDDAGVDVVAFDLRVDDHRHRLINDGASPRRHGCEAI
jgi:hypothetical protein